MQVAQAFDDASHVEHHVLGGDFFGARDDETRDWSHESHAKTGVNMAGFIAHTAAQFGSASGEKKWDGLRKSLTLRIDEF